MSVKVSALCWKVRLPATEKLILMRMADFADDQGFNIYPAVQTVADDCGVTTRAVQLTLKKMVRDGVLVIINQGGGRGKATEYAIDMDVMHKLRAEPESGKHKYNGHDAQHGKGENSERGSPLNGANPERGSPIPAENHENPERGSINPERDSPHPLESVKEEGGGGYARAPACEVRTMVAGLTGLPADERNLETVKVWLKDGYDPQQDIYPAIVKAIPTAKGEIGCFRYFTKAIDREHKARTTPQPVHRNVVPMNGRRAVEPGAAELLALIERKRREMS